MSLLARAAARRLTVLAVMVSLLSTLFASAHPLAETDRDCGPLTMGHARTPAAWKAVTPPPTDDHCAFCHWLRAVGGASPLGSVGTIPAVTATLALRQTGVASVSAAALGPRSSRAPPCALTTV